MRILLIWPGHRFSTADVANGYEKAFRNLGHEVKSYNYHNAIDFYYAGLQRWKERNSIYEFDLNSVLTMASEHVVIDAVDFVPDVVLIICGYALHRRAYDLLHRLCLPMAIILTESPYSNNTQKLMLSKGHISVAFANDKNSVNTLAETGVPTVYLPHSYDPEIHRPRKAAPSFVSDVFFHGTLFPERQELLFPLMDLPYDVCIGGLDPSEADNPDDVEEMLEGLMDNRELAYWYAGTKIAINHHRTFCGTNDQNEELHISERAAWSIGPRAFEIAACGAFQLCDDVRPELVDVFGDSVATYKNGDDLVDKISYYMENNAEREDMAREALKCVQDCTFEARAKEIVVPALEEVL